MKFQNRIQNQRCSEMRTQAKCDTMAVFFLHGVGVIHYHVAFEGFHERILSLCAL